MTMLDDLGQWLEDHEAAAVATATTDLTTEIATLNGSIDSLNEQATNNAATIAELQAAKAADEATIQSLTAQISDREAEISALNGQIDAANSNIADLEAQVATLNAQHTADLATIADLEAQLAALQPDPPAPAPMTLVGATCDGGNPTIIEAALGGEKLQVFRSYFQAPDGASALASRANADVAAGRLPFMSTKLPYSWAVMASGSQDAWLNARIDALAAVPGEVWLVLHHEPRGDGPAADWVAMQQHARTLIDARSDNIKLVGVLNGWSFLDPTSPDAESYRHPVGTGVHLMAFDSYNAWSPTNGKAWSTVETVFSPGLTIQSWGYQTAVGEFGVRTDPDHPGKAAQWITDAYAFGNEHKFAAMCYFHSGQNSPDGPWTLDGERLVAYKAALVAAKA